jgi:hypothetical protein
MRFLFFASGSFGLLIVVISRLYRKEFGTFEGIVGSGGAERHVGLISLWVP